MGWLHDASRRISGPRSFGSPPTRTLSAPHREQLAPLSPFADALKQLGLVGSNGQLVGQDNYNWQLLGSAGQGMVPRGQASFESVDGLMKGQGANPYASQSSGGKTDVDSPKGIFWDPYLASLQLGYRERPTWVNYGLCNVITGRVPIIPNLVQLRVRHVENFSKRSTHKYEQGVRVRPKDPTVTLTPADKREIARIEEIIFPTADPEKGIESFLTIGSKMIKDSMIHDQVCLQVQNDRAGRPYRIYHMDATTIRLAALPTLGPALRGDRPYAVQIKDGVVVETFTSDELLFHVRNPRTDIYGFGYGTPEIEMLLSACTTFLNAWQYNSSAFTNGALTKGMINLMGERIPEAHLQDFREQFYTMLSGPSNFFRVPILNMSGQVQYVPFNGSNRDMEFSAWTDFLIKLICAIFSTDPIEIGFKYGNSSGKQMFEGASKSKVIESKERALRPLLTMRETIYGRVIDRINPDFCLEHIGLEPVTQKELADLDAMLVKTTMTINEVRKKNHIDPLPPELGDIILEPNYLQNRANVMAKAEKAKADKKAELLSEAHIAALIGADEASELTPEDIQMIQGVLDGSAPASIGPAADTVGGFGKGGGSDPGSIAPSGQGGGPGGGRVAPTLE